MKRCKINRCGIKSGAFIEIVFLSLLAKKPSYGYKLIEEAARFGIPSEVLEKGIAYRILRKLENMGLVVSEWDTTEGGMPKRMYRVTDIGIEVLREWYKDSEASINTLIKLREWIKTIIGEQ